ncbi:DUF2254 domain-containing protein [Pseudoprimorskyibacter insulae]|uniref:DUF2254 domain-containing protein n=1 Tax=Pseudoprimorskyibacter insulae TaxID=1695997 RepID=A0A2R8AWY1_9RHOB|nr:DUF2254 domain-containing protein [Pseudoprimorskyibacter insulae]SPF80389.1 hypothetical protein PRI8871_02194 [Pseudoprimorskyibacter insulae]
MLSSILRRLRQISRRIYVRVILIAVLSLLAVGLAPVLAPFIPEDFAQNIGADALGPILTILASSMLGVTTFSLTIMVTGFTKATSQWTPRSQNILREDTVTHSVLANFLGAYLYSLMAIILRATDVFDHRDVVVLFGVTLIVVALVVVSFIRWIVHLEGIGSLHRTASALEEQAATAIAGEGAAPCLGCRPLTDPLAQIPDHTVPVRAEVGGYLLQIFEDRLQGVATLHDGRIFVIVPVGQFVYPGDVLAYVDGIGRQEDDAFAKLRAAMPIGDMRSFEQDPAFALTTLSEIALRALSPGINDPGTAVDIANRLGRCLALLDAPTKASAPRLDRVWLPGVTADALVKAAFDPMSRCAGGAAEVHSGILYNLDKLTDARNPDLALAAATCAERCRKRAAHLVADIDQGLLV